MHQYCNYFRRSGNVLHLRSVSPEFATGFGHSVFFIKAADEKASPLCVLSLALMKLIPSVAQVEGEVSENMHRILPHVIRNESYILFC